MRNDLLLAYRRLRREPGFALIAVITLALAIGANTAVFSIADAVLFRPLPYEDADRLFIVQMLDPATGNRYLLTPHEHLQALAANHSGIEGVGMLEDGNRVLVDSGSGFEPVRTAVVTANYFDVAGVRAARGRLFATADTQAFGRPTVLTWGGWQRRFGGNESIVGSAASLGTQTFDVIGVLPQNFVIPHRFGNAVEIVTLMEPVPAGAGDGTFHPIVRLRPGVERVAAQQEVELIAARLTAAGDRQTAEVPVLDDVRGVLYPTGRPIMRFLLAAAGLVLFLGCANLANMLLARTRRREKEVGIQVALGAQRLSLLRPVFIEAVFLGLCGAAAALLVTSIAFEALLRQVPEAALRSAPVAIDLRVVGFALGLGVLGGAVFAVIPAWRATRTDAKSLISGYVHDARARYFGRPMLVVQVALAIVLVFGAAIAARAFVDVLQVPLGFDPENVITIDINPRLDNGLERQAFYERALATIGQRGDIVSASASGSIPLGRSAPDDGVDDPASPGLLVGIYHVLPGYFDTIGIPLLRGRLLTADDVRSGAGVAVVTESSSRTLFADRDPIGGTFRSSGGRELTVVGVVGEVRQSLSRQEEPPAYVIGGDGTRALTLVAKAAARNDETLAALSREISRLAPSVPISAGWWTDSIGDLTEIRNPRFQTLVLGTFAALALGLTGLGVFGIVAFLVASRMREMGIRLAIGATPRSLVALMIRRTLSTTAAGVLISLLATRWLAQLAEAQLYEVNTRDPLTLGAAVLAVAVAALIAAYLPARHAGRVNPMTVLRME